MEQATGQPALRRNLLQLAAGVFFLSFGFSIYLGVVNNFMVEGLGMEPRQLGVLESMREVPGILSAFLGGLLIFLAEPVLAGLALVVMGLGFLSMFLVGTWWQFLFAALLWSIGFHVWAPLSATLVLAVAETGREGRRMGQVGAAGSIAGPLGLALVYLTARTLSFRQLFLIAGVAVLVAAFTISRVKVRNFYQRRQRVVIRREYGVYYLLTFLDGCRKQIFTTFAIFVLVKVYHTSLSTVAVLMAINGLAGLLISPRVGRLVDWWGEKRSLTLNYCLIVLVFAGYATCRSPHVLYVLFCSDSVLFSFNVALSTYLNRIARPEDVRPTLAMGVSSNHVAAVITPLVGGLLWAAVGYQPVFWGGAGVVLLALLATRLLPEAKPRPVEGRVTA